MKDKAFEIGKTYRHSTGAVMHIVGSAFTHTYGACLIGEDEDGYMTPVGQDVESSANWEEVRQCQIGWGKDE